MADWPYNTAAWARLRTAKLARDPMCKPCEDAGRLTMANTVDHNHAISDGGLAFPSLDDLTSMCPPCHGAKTARGSEAGAIRSTKPRKGCDADGNPLDPAHPWHEKSLGAAGQGPTPALQTQLVPTGLGSEGLFGLVDPVEETEESARTVDRIEASEASLDAAQFVCALSVGQSAVIVGHKNLSVRGRDDPDYRARYGASSQADALDPKEKAGELERG